MFEFLEILLNTAEALTLFAKVVAWVIDGVAYMVNLDWGRPSLWATAAILISLGLFCLWVFWF